MAGGWPLGVSRPTFSTFTLRTLVHAALPQSWWRRDHHRGRRQLNRRLVREVYRSTRAYVCDAFTHTVSNDVYTPATQTKSTDKKWHCFSPGGSTVSQAPHANSSGPAPGTSKGHAAATTKGLLHYIYTCVSRQPEGGQHRTLLPCPDSLFTPIR